MALCSAGRHTMGNYSAQLNSDTHDSSTIVRVDIFTYYFVYLEYFPIILIYLESLFYRLSFDIIFA